LCRALERGEHRRLVCDAQENGETARVEMLMRELAQIGLRYR